MEHFGQKTLCVPLKTENNMSLKGRCQTCNPLSCVSLPLVPIYGPSCPHSVIISSDNPSLVS